MFNKIVYFVERLNSMGRSILKIIIPAILLVSLQVAPITANAMSSPASDWWKEHRGDQPREYSHLGHYHKVDFQPQVGQAVPEIDASGAAIAISLLVGVVGLARERRRR